MNKFVMYFVMLFCQNASSFIERVRNSGFEKLSSRAVLELPEVLLCPFLISMLKRQPQWLNYLKFMAHKKIPRKKQKS